MHDVSTRTAARILRWLPRERLTRAIGKLSEARVPRVVLDPVLDLYTRAYAVDLSEAVMPPRGYASFNEFFTRKLREGSRPIDPDPRAMTSPADGRLDDAGDVTHSQTFEIKGQTYDVGGLLASADRATDFAGGSFAVVYLSPRDYHRVHAPCAARVTFVRHVPGTLFPVNSLGVRAVPLLFARNERVVIGLESERFGPVVVIMVGAMVVGGISLAFDAPERPPLHGTVSEIRFANGSGPMLRKGDELGAFKLGSTVVLLTAAGASGSRLLVQGTLPRAVRMGEAIGRLAS